MRVRVGVRVRVRSTRYSPSWLGVRIESWSYGRVNESELGLE